MKHLLPLLFFIFCWQSGMAQNAIPQHHLLKKLATKPYGKQTVGTASEKSSKNVKTQKRKNARTQERKNARTLSLPDSIGPLLPDQWDQEGPLRGMTPLLPSGERCVVGCVALAMAQVMHKWEYPQWGTGTLTYDDSLGCGQVLTGEFYKHHYDWANMLDKYVEGEYTQQQAYAGALLCSDCGISVQMKYGSTSGAQPVQQAIALPTYFGYDEGVQIYFRDFYTKDEITQMLKQELAAGRPVLISAYNHVGGHAFVIDGYNKDDWFHINVGNPDKEFDGDGWTPLDCMAPNQPAYFDVDSPESGLNLLQIFVMGAIPATHTDATHTETHVYAMQRMEAVDTEAARGENMRVCVRDLSNIGRSLHSDSVSLVLLKDGETVCPVYTYDRTFLLEEVDDTTYTDTLSILLPSDLATGMYTLQPIYKDNGTWQAVRTSVGTPNYLLCDIGDDVVTLSSDTANTAYLTLEDFDVPDLIINGSAPEINLTLKAHNAEFSGRIYLYMEPIDERCKEFYLIRQGVTMQPGEVSVRRCHKTKIYAPKTGRYRLHFLYDNNLFADEMLELTDQTIEVSVLHAGVIQIARR